MKNQTTSAGRGHRSTSLHYYLIRNVTSDEEKRFGVQTHIANLPAREILALGTEDNLRDYIGASKPKKRNGTHLAIEETLYHDTERFINRNSGFTIACKSIKIDDSKKIIELYGGSIINGAQSRGEIERYFRSCDLGEQDEVEFTVRAEIIVDPDPTSITETAIARNTATAVKSQSQANKRGYLDGLAKSVERHLSSDLVLRRTETDEGDLDPLELVQLARLLMPEDVIGLMSNSELLRPYCGKARCFTEFNKWAELVINDEQSHTDYDQAKLRYDFTVQMAPIAYEALQQFKTHGAWKGLSLRSQTKEGGKIIERGKNRAVTVLKNGLLFPLLSALRVFVKRDKNGNWTLLKPKIFSDDRLVKSAANQLRAHKNNPMMMGRSASSYEALLEYTRTIMEAMESIERL
ncbi:MAG: hypothetical protein EBY38_07130 [Flavobacteriaceae bacterium]|nr:hypothetical protein [Flavobacteriaceae bacterium]